MKDHYKYYDIGLLILLHHLSVIPPLIIGTARFDYSVFTEDRYGTLRYYQDFLFMCHSLLEATKTIINASSSGIDFMKVNLDVPTNSEIYSQNLTTG